MANDGNTAYDVDARVRSLLASGDAQTAVANEAVRAFAPEVLGYLIGVVGSEADADEIFAAVSLAKALAFTGGVRVALLAPHLGVRARPT